MMRAMRSRVLSGFFALFLVLAGFSLVLTDWTGSFRSGVGQSDVARLGSERIGQMEFAQMVGRAAQNENLSPQQAFQIGLVHRVLTSEIWNRMLAHTAYAYGLAASDDMVVKYLQDMAAPIAQMQKTTPANVIKNFLRQQNVSEAQFLATLQREIVNDMMRDVIMGTNAAVSPLVLDALLTHEGQKRDLRFIVLRDDALTDIKEPDAKALAAYYETEKANYLTPERRDLRFATLTREAVKKALPPLDDAAIRAYYDAHKEELKTPETRTLETVVYQSSDAALAKKLIAAASQVSDILAEGKKLGTPVVATTQTVTRDALPPELAEAVFKAKEHELVGPIESPMGWHIVRISTITPAGVPAFEAAKTAVHDKLAAEALDKVTGDRVDQIDKAVTQGDTLDSLVKEQGMSLTSFSGLTREGKTVEGTDALKDLPLAKAAILSTGFAGNETAQLHGPLELPNGDIAVLVVEKIIPAAPKPLESIRAELTKKWLAAEQRRANLTRSQGALMELLSKRTTLEKVAQARGVTVETITQGTRKQADLPKGLDRAAWLRLFDAELGQPVFQPLTGAIMIGVVDHAILPDRAQIKDDTVKEVRDRLIQAQENEALTQFMGALNERYNVRINDRLLKAMFAPRASDTE